MVSAELQGLIQLMQSQPREAEQTIEQNRAGFEAMAQMFPAPAGTQSEKVTANGVPAEWITGPGAEGAGTLLYLHGGGYVIGSVNTHRGLVSRLSTASGMRALSADYRLAPEHPFPAAVDDAVAAYRWLLANGAQPETTVIAGDSAGGGLTFATLVALRDAGEPLPAAAVALSPWVDLEGIGESMTTNAAGDPMVQKAGLQQMAQVYLGGADPRTPLAAPLYADLVGLPPLLIQVGTAETLLDDSNRIAAKAKAAGVEVTLEPWEDMIHVWQIFPVPEADQAIERLGQFIRQKTSRA